ncbi:MAG TPA: phage holin family protein [Bacteroidetes bacterium]|nr:phage holin family protein [Bacteroidota bacterium]
MSNLIYLVLINAVAVWLGARILRGVKVDGFVSALIVGLVVAGLNCTLGSVLDFLATPIIWITLGLFAFVIDAVVLKVADYFLKGLEIENFWWAVALALLVSVVNMVAHILF